VKVLVTGGTQFDGLARVWELARHGHDARRSRDFEFSFEDSLLERIESAG